MRSRIASRFENERVRGAARGPPLLGALAAHPRPFVVAGARSGGTRHENTRARIEATSMLRAQIETLDTAGK